MTPKTRMLVLQRDNYQCQITGIKDQSLHIHHKIPRRFGGTDDPENLITIATSIHRSVELGRLSSISKAQLKTCGITEKEFFDKIKQLGLDNQYHKLPYWCKN